MIGDGANCDDGGAVSQGRSQRQGHAGVPLRRCGRGFRNRGCKIGIVN